MNVDAKDGRAKVIERDFRRQYSSSYLEKMLCESLDDLLTL